MPSPNEILRAIELFEPSDGDWRPLDALLDRLWQTEPSESWLPVLLSVFERFPEDDGAGVLWSIVHGIESLPYEYQELLRASFERRPSLMAGIMIRRLARMPK